MNAVDSELRRLIVEAGLVAVNHGFPAQAREILEALPDLVAEPRLRKLLEAAMLIGLGEREEAARLLRGDESVEADTLRMLLTPESSKPARFPPAHMGPHTNGMPFDK